VARHGWPELAARVRIKCFSADPSIASSLKFLRRTPWAREKVEAMYVREHRIMARNAKRNRRRKELRARGFPPEGAAPGSSNETET
jgi:uncharacterized protein (DUF2132 family)